MQHLFGTIRPGTRLALLLLPAWLATGCEAESIRLGGWVSSPAERTPAPSPPAAAAPVPPPPVAPPPPVGPIPGGGPGGEGEMPLSVHELLRTRCAECHTYGVRDPAGWGSVLDLTRLIDSQIVVPGEPESSRLWYRVAVRADMPFNGQRLNPEEKATLLGWIQGLQRPWPRPRTQAQILDLLVHDEAAAGNGSDTRYVSFADFVDARRPPEEIRAAAGVFKVILNSLSRRASIVEPVALDPDGSIWRFRLGDLGWSEQDWNRLISFYPYCMPSDTDRHRDLYQRLRTEAPIVRGDWFLSTALTPPVYHELLQLGGNLDEIARLRLGVDIDVNIAQGRVQRIAQRGPGTDDRVLERHEAPGGGYLWLTYHLVPGEDVRRSPLGPRNRNDDFGRSFSITATDALWSLPNGLQAYLLADADGNRIDTASPAVAIDPRRRKGIMENATACNGCHGASGLQRPGSIADIAGHLEQRSADFGPLEREQILRIYPAGATQTLAADAARYQETIRGLLGDRRPGADSAEWDDFVTLRGQYESKLGLRQGALELGTNPITVRRELQASPSSRAPLPELLTEPLVPREEWMCQFRRVARDVRGVGLCAGSFTNAELVSYCDRQDAEAGR